ncbi:MAG: hypothetical protein V1880_04450, partial [Patescibacteria group bacterium]
MRLNKKNGFFKPSFIVDQKFFYFENSIQFLLMGNFFVLPYEHKFYTSPPSSFSAPSPPPAP